MANKEVFGVQSTSFTNLNQNTDQAVSADLLPTNIHNDIDTKLTAHPVDLRETVPEDLLQINSAAMGGGGFPPDGCSSPDEGWLRLGTAQPQCFHAVPVISPSMDHLDHWCSRPNVPIPSEIAPVIKHRTMSSMPECEPGLPSDEWILNTRGESLIFFENRTKKDSRRSLAALDVLHEHHAAKRKAAHLCIHR